MDVNGKHEMAAKGRLGCLHMHHSNIAYIEGIVATDRVELLHFVDPGLMRRIGSDPDFTRDQGEAQVRRQLEWMAIHLLLFTNPATVEGTMRRFHDYAHRAGQQPSIEIDVMPGTFDLVLAGKTEEYAAVVTDQLRALVRSGRYQAISVGQLSMAESALRIAAETGVPIDNPLDSLRLHLAHELGTSTVTN